MAEPRTAFELLLDMDRRCRSLAAGLPLQEAHQQDWVGIGFRMGEQRFVAPIREIAEILHEPRHAVMPGVKSWVSGVANLRGRLLPLMDLCGFFGLEAMTARKQRRVLVVEHNEVFAGLLVDEVLGMQRFSQLSLIPQTPQDVDQGIAPFLRGQFIREQAWQVFSPWAVVQSADFMDLAS
ncbi:chemotaxis protein CheW [Pseudomonas tremae]|uniref:chemotaxis protein CheW n=1 Tax=Pseudomonas syringae group TaxID=136849 RepID=UPI0006D603E7|nr:MULTISPECIES: chemotaxis protein CheW [Pseudomonas syringae group]KPW41807.1 Type IV pilus bioproteinsis protein PilI [Pseudomonas coronafaciens pv. atropurpurea]MCQ2988223.1 chemotaxis protein CheW [Pseudomonas tremae]RMT58260.1 Type IV pilus bioproteinsis protein PilI [Pseudomonas coronafaciens pv. atropurpurea]